MKNNSDLIASDYPNSNTELRRVAKPDSESLAGKTSATVPVSHINANITQVGNYNINSETET